MRTKDVLKEALLAFDGTVILVSHDRDFLNGLAEKVYEFGGGKVREHLGGIYDFLQKKELESLDSLNTTNNSPAPAEPKTSQPAPLSYEERKEAARTRRKAEKRAEECEARVEKLEEEKKKLEALLATPQGASDAELFNTYSLLEQQIKAAEADWENALEALE